MFFMNALIFAGPLFESDSEFYTFIAVALVGAIITLVLFAHTIIDAIKNNRTNWAIALGFCFFLTGGLGLLLSIVYYFLYMKK